MTKNNSIPDQNAFIANFIFTCKEDVVKLKFHNFGQVIRACNNHMEAFLEENKIFWLGHSICPPAKITRVEF